MKKGQLQFTKEGVMYKYGRPLTLTEVNIKSVGGKKFKSLNEAFLDLKKQLKKLGKT